MSQEQEIQRLKSLVITQRALVEARNLALGGHTQQIYALADAFELVPELLLHWDATCFERIAAAARGYQEKYEGAAYDYLSILNMDANHFRAVYGMAESYTSCPA